MSAMTATDFYVPRDIKRNRSTNADLERLDSAIFDYCSEQNPITVRGVFYAMSVRGLIPKDDSGYRRVQRRVLEMRRAHLLPYDWISDSTRWMRKPNVHRNLQSMLRDAQQFYRRDIWADQNAYVEIWCEKDALAGVIMEATKEWHVPLMVSRGFASDTYLHESARHLAQQGKPAFVYLFTDCDAAGFGIDAKIRDGLRRHSGGAEIQFRRGALTREQVNDWQLPTRDPKPVDRKAGFDSCCELDAIPPRQLVDMVTSHIFEHLDKDKLTKTLVVEMEEQATLDQIASVFA